MKIDHFFILGRLGAKMLPNEVRLFSLTNNILYEHVISSLIHVQVPAVIKCNCKSLSWDPLPRGIIWIVVPLTFACVLINVAKYYGHDPWTKALEFGPLGIEPQGPCACATLGLRATSHTGQGPWPCNGEGPLLFQRPYCGCWDSRFVYLWALKHIMQWESTLHILSVE